MIRVGCTDCRHYSLILKRCIKGWANPKTRSQTFDVIKFMGWSYICSYDEWKQKAIQQQEVR